VTDMGGSGSAFGIGPAQIEQLRERAERVRAELAATRATTQSSDGSVSLTVGAGGVLLAIEFTASAKSTSNHQLAISVMSAYRAACRQAAERSVEVVSEMVGPDSPTLALMRDAVPPEDEDEPGEPGQ